MRKAFYSIRTMSSTASLTHLLLISLALMLTSCGEAGEHIGHATPVLHHIEADTTFQDNDGLTSEPYLDGVARVPVEGIAHEIPFYVRERTGELEKYPCAECHTQPVAALRAANPDERNAHWDIAIQHASEDIMQCSTCHAGNDMNSLQLLSGKPVAFDHSYQVCAQCHSTQAYDWVGGAHGKRLGGWAAPRVVNNCAACHNPHQPAWEPRWPARATRLAE